MRRPIEYLAAILAALLAAGCSDGTPVGPATGELEVAAVTTGEDIDPDGYVVVMRDRTRAIGVNQTVTLSDLTPGDQEVELTEIAPNCVVAGSNPRTVRVRAGARASIGFSVACQELGTLEVATVTTGQDLDPDGYVLWYEAGWRGWAIGVTDTFRIRLHPGNHSVELIGVAPNCAVTGSPWRPVEIRSGVTVRITFEVGCQVVPPLSGRIAFWSLSGSSVEIHVMNLDGSGPMKLTDGAEPAVSPDGTRILFVRSGDIYLMNASGSGIVNLTNHAASDSRPRWSPDGTRIAFTSDRDAGGALDIFVMEADGSNPTNLTRNDANDNAATWSPNGTKIAFTTNRTGEFEIFVMDADGSNPTNLTNDPTRSDYGPAWSPDGGKIAFASDRDASGEIFVMNVDGSNPVNLTDHPGHDTWPSWSRDGSRIAFTSNRTGSFQVFVMNADGSAPMNLSNSPGSQHYAGFPQAWSP